MDVITRGRWGTSICNLSHCIVSKLVATKSGNSNEPQIVLRDLKSSTDHKQLLVFVGVVHSSSLLEANEVGTLSKKQKYIDIIVDEMEAKRSLNAAAFVFRSSTLKLYTYPNFIRFSTKQAAIDSGMFDVYSVFSRLTSLCL